MKESANQLISIIIPTLSRGVQEDHFIALKRLLSEHLPKQTYGDYEALVLSDGPNDKVGDFISRLNDRRVSFVPTVEALQFGHPQTRQGIRLAAGDFVLRMNDDNIPYCNYLQTLLDGFIGGVDIVYARVLFKSSHRASFNKWYKMMGLLRFGYPFVMPKDFSGRLVSSNIDCMNYMVRMDIAKKNVDSWSDACEADWHFLESLLKRGARARFMNKVVGEKY